MRSWKYSLPAPVLVLGPPPSAAPTKPVSTAEGRCGLVDTDEDRVLYDRTIGCQIRTAREIKEGQVMMKVPQSVMVHPDLVATSDPGWAALACVQPLEPGANFWAAFGNTSQKEKSYLDKISSMGGTQVLVKILQERKKVETVLTKAAQAMKDQKSSPNYKLASRGVISTRSVFMLFLIHQRFSDEESPRVCSDDIFNISSIVEDASVCIDRQEVPDGTPETFAPYARTLPPSVPLPMCWKRNELALLAGCISGLPVLQEVAAQILALSSDLIALVGAGIFHRFPSLFSPELLTWDRWLWAASVYISRSFPTSFYMNAGEDKAVNHQKSPGELFYSPPGIWDELGVMIPLMDMLNHEVEEAQIKWEGPEMPKDGDDEYMLDEIKNEDKMVARVVVHIRVKKGSQIYRNYCLDSSKEQMIRYGFAQMANDADSIPIGWGLDDCVGNVPKADDYVSIGKNDEEGKEASEEDTVGLLYKSSKTEAINLWWNEDRLSILEEEMQSDPLFWTTLRNGKKITTTVLSDGTCQPILLTAMVVATMSPWAVQNHKEKSRSAEGGKPQMVLTKRHQNILRNYMLFLYSGKLERLLQNLSEGLKAHFNNVVLWEKANEGGLEYNNSDEMDTSENASKPIGWNSFFDSFAYSAAMEVEERYYSLAPDSCVLKFYDAYLRAIQASIDGVISDAAFRKKTAKQLEGLGFVLLDEDRDEEIVENILELDTEKEEKEDAGQKQSESSQSSTKETQKKQETNNGGGNGGSVVDNKKEKKKNRQRNNRKIGGPPAIKLHIGNLSYQTTQSRLFDFFTGRYGRDSVIECHIPTERETGKSRGFGFVTMPESIALRILGENLPHDIDGRVVKIAESNTSVQARTGQNGGAVPAPNDRYGFHHGMHGGPMPMMGYMPGHMHPPDDIYGPSSNMPSGGMDPYDYGGYGRGIPPEHEVRSGRRRSRSWNGRRSYSRSPSPRYRRRDYSRERHYERTYRDRRGRSYSRSRSRSYSRGRDRRDRESRRDRERNWDRESRRSSRRSRGSSRRSSRYSRSRSRSLSRSRSPSYSKDAGSSSRRDRERERKSSGGSSNIDSSSAQNRAGRSRSQSQGSSPLERNVEIEHNKRAGGKSSRRGRSKSRIGWLL